MMMINLPIILALILLLQRSSSAKTVVKTEVFLSPEIVLEPGFVSNKNYYNIDFPRDHIALKGFTAELVDAAGDPVPLLELYLHHWVLQRYYTPTYNAGINRGDDGLRLSNYSMVRNSGICDGGLTYYYGVGAETRRTSTDVPDPYGIHVGDPASVPAGYEEGWMLNIHAIDLRGVEDGMGCSECRCDLYGATREIVASGYKGGLRCCADEKRCRMKEGFQFLGEKRKVYLRYTVKYVGWDPSSIVAVQIYVLDVTDVWTKGDESKGIRATHHCGIEYDIEACEDEKYGCIDSKILSVSLPSGGDMIYGVGHQHAGAIGISLYGEGGRKICSSNPIYGEGSEAGNEAGYIVGMSTCYPSPAGAVKISAGETLTLVSNYTRARSRTGVMALFYLLLADSPPKPPSFLVIKITRVPIFVWPMALLGGVLLLVAALAWKGKSGKTEGYEAML